ncbi:Detected protein of unknown function [Hibiscus syriacus]|uniref:Uncharacterized protein n=1 Tax=Hibiscus syriacus TaxID=106335 RepID=A0A6A3BR87_HIBSY|nr:Detected protein of unknown function [Hibiscus syriacus]
MAASPLNVQPSFHARSNSLPSRQHPITSQIDENVNRLRASQSASTSSSMGDKLNCLQDLYEYVDMFLQLPLTHLWILNISTMLKSNESATSSSPSLTRNLSALRDLYELVYDLLQLPVTQQSLAQQCNDKQVNELLNESLKLLDVCGVSKDIYCRPRKIHNNFNINYEKKKSQ